MNYWEECVSCALDEAGILATKEQIAIAAKVVEGGASQESMAYQKPEGNDELKMVKELLRKEKSKRVCKVCVGEGRIIEACGVAHVSNMECHNCYGAGKV